MSVPAPQFRITLFYGPESIGDEQPCQRCVFNVKKRSWKGGVQIVVEVAETQVNRLLASLEFSAWIHSVLSNVPQEDRAHYESRARELFVQEICSLKLSRALDSDGRQDNTFISWNQWLDELDALVVSSTYRIKANILTELDLAL